VPLRGPGREPRDSGSVACELNAGPLQRPQLGTEDIEQGVERYAATLPEADRLYALLNANPLHVDRTGTVRG
jgi:hypothetical protein